MNKYRAKANAKINLGLNVYEKLANSYHKLESIMAPIDLCDEIEVEFEDSFSQEIIINVSDKNIPCDSNNTLHKTFLKFNERLSEKKLVKNKKITIDLKKNIPSEAGLGGGSSDAGAFLKILNTYYDDVFSLEELEKIAIEIGSDVPFFIKNKTAKIEKIGEKIEILENNLDTYILLLKPDFGISTKSAYQDFDTLRDEKKKYSNFENIKKALKENSILMLEKNIENCLEQGQLEKNSLVISFRKQLGAVFQNKKFFMSGSGSSYFSFISEKEKDMCEVRAKTFLDNVQVNVCKLLK